MRCLNRPASEGGAALVISLMILLIMTVLGLSAIKTSLLDTRIVANLKEQRIAFQMAETGLELKLQTLVDGLGDFESAYTAADGKDTSSISTGDLGMTDSTISIEIEALGLGGYAKGSSIPKFMVSRFSIKATATRTGSKAVAVHRRGVDVVIPGR